MVDNKMPMTLANLALTAIAALLGATVILLMLKQRRLTTTDDVIDKEDCTVALFRDGLLVDTTPQAEALLDGTERTLSAVLSALSAQFPDVIQTMTAKDDWHGNVVCRNDENAYLRLTCVKNSVRMQFHGAITLETRETSLLRDIHAHAPQLIWQTDASGTAIWSNAAYDAEVTDDASPLADIIIQDNPTQRIAMGDDDQRWFDVTSVAQDDKILHFATDTTAIMRADQNRRDFVKALGKTFADLSTGLAIFDKNRRLAMFNPALLDMTRLPFEFLSGTPKIDTLLDRLREIQVMPEPKNYTSWRDEFTTVESAAKKGTYSENWSLPDGQTFRVTGRPHPDGAFALLFEDITAEISLTRRFRSDIETGQAVLDNLLDAIAVFSGAGTLVMANKSYGQLWGVSPELMLEHREIISEMSNWQDSCIASPMWTEMRNFVQKIGARKAWVDDAMLIDGRHLRCHAVPISGGMTMVRFVIAPAMRPVLQKLTQIDPAIRVGKG